MTLYELKKRASATEALLIEEVLKTGLDELVQEEVTRYQILLQKHLLDLITNHQDRYFVSQFRNALLKVHEEFKNGKKTAH